MLKLYSQFMEAFMFNSLILYLIYTTYTCKQCPVSSCGLSTSGSMKLKWKHIHSSIHPNRTSLLVLFSGLHLHLPGAAQSGAWERAHCLDFHTWMWMFHLWTDWAELRSCVCLAVISFLSKVTHSQHVNETKATCSMKKCFMCCRLSLIILPCKTYCNIKSEERQENICLSSIKSLLWPWWQLSVIVSSDSWRWYSPTNLHPGRSWIKLFSLPYYNIRVLLKLTLVFTLYPVMI